MCSLVKLFIMLSPLSAMRACLAPCYLLQSTYSPRKCTLRVAGDILLPRSSQAPQEPSQTPAEAWRQGGTGGRAGLVEEEPRIAVCALRMGAPALMVRTPFLPGWVWSMFQVFLKKSISLPVRFGFGRYTMSFLGLHHGGPISTSKPGHTHSMPHLGTSG